MPILAIIYLLLKEPHSVVLRPPPRRPFVRTGFQFLRAPRAPLVSERPFPPTLGACMEWIAGV
jgi:hypothetical protein